MSESAWTESDWRSMLSRQSIERGRLYQNLALGILGDIEAAHDVCQQAFMKAWKQRHTIRQPERIHSWLCRTVLNESFALLRRKGVEKRALNDLVYWPHGQEGPDEQLARSEWAIVALAQLEEPTRSVVVLRFLQGLSGNEASRILECSPSEISRRLHQGLEQLRSWMNRTEQAS